MKQNYELKKSALWVKFTLWLMNFTWGMSEKHFTNICPFVWLSVLNLFILPGTIVVKTINFIFSLIGKIIPEKKQRNTNLELYQKLTGPNAEEEIAKFVKTYNSKNSTKWIFIQSYLYYKDEVLHKRLLLLIKERDEQKELAKKKMLFSQVPLIKKIFSWATLIGGISFLIYILIILGAKINMKAVLGLLIVLGALTVILGLIYVISRLCETTKFGTYVSIPFVFIWKCISAPFKFMYSLYKENCPGLTFKD